MRCAIVSGAAGGIGLALVAAFRDAGYRVIATDRMSRPPTQQCDAYVEADLQRTVSDPAYAAQVFGIVLARIGHDSLATLVNNAAVQILGGVEKLSVDDWRQSLHWDADREALWMVDIHGCRVIKWRLDAPAWQEWLMAQRTGWVIHESGTDRLLLGLQQGIAISTESDLPATSWIARPFETRGAMRLNDAKADPSGAVWAGSMNNDDESRADGCLYRLSTDHRLEQADCGYCVPNGPAIHPDGGLLLHTDSRRSEVYAFDLDHVQGRIANKRLWRRFAENEGYPDGMCFDAAECVLIAQWGAGCVSQFGPDGNTLRVVELPTPLVTNVCFAGPELNRMFVTTARMTTGQDPTPDAGALIEVIGHQTRGTRTFAYGTSPG